jgi:hypothetical protein
MPICEAGRPNHYRDSPEPRRFGTVSPHDPGLFSTVEECADQIVAGHRDGRYTPLWVANQLDALANNATDKLQGARAASGDVLAPRVRRVDIDVSIQAALGHFFASKLRAGVAYALSRRTGSVRRLREAVEAYIRARAAWTLAIEHGDVYRQDITVGGEPFLRGHWKDRLAAIIDDLGDMQAELASAASSEADDAPVVPLGRLEQPAPSMFYDHVPPATFTRGPSLPVGLTATCAESPQLSVRLHYRQLNQAERWQAVEMAERSGQFIAEIPAAVTDSPFAVQYFFEIRDRPDRAWMYPGLDASLANRPYVVVRQA